MEYQFEAKMWEWRGPAPFYFMTVPEEIGQEIKEQSAQYSYGWGMIPVSATIGKTEFQTAMFQKNDSYVLPIKNAVRLPEKLELDKNYKVIIRLGSTL
ncbi:MAG: DUF1905 domain-containing protein [Aquiluna sp.]|nr:DUF1905 domain-containing protein [Aquiluna sp.]MCF8546161.1 DUF1905 domain-containing protein [Aquiluna sp.]